MKTNKWQYFGDVNMLDYGGKNSRCIGNRQFQFVELINMDDACGRDNKGKPKYVVELRMVDLSSIPEKTIRSALDSCGIELEIDITEGNEGNDIFPADNILAETCDSYGAHAPIGSWSGNNARKLLREAYSEAKSLLDSEALEEKLEQPVNRIGSSAREFMQGDIFSAMQRGCESGSPDARIMAKMCGVEQYAIDDARPVDFLPYLMGYMCAMSGGTKETDPDTALEYFRGYDRGVNVKQGKAPAPGWIKQGQPS